MPNPFKAIVLGATGQTGRHLFTCLLANPAINQVTDAGRRSAIEAGVVASEVTGKEKLEKPVILDLGLGEAQCATHRQELQDKDIVYITLGTTRKNAGSAEKFEAIDRGYPVLFAKLARTPDKPQTLVYLSATGASVTSPLLYNKSKALTELELSGLGYEQTIIFRPGLLVGTDRSETRIAEQLAGKLTGLASYFTDSIQIPVATLGLAMSKAGVMGYSGLEEHRIGSKVNGNDGQAFWVVGNADAIKLAKIDI